MVSAFKILIPIAADELPAGDERSVGLLVRDDTGILGAQALAHLRSPVNFVVISDASKQGLAAGDFHRHLVISGDVQAVDFGCGMAFELFELQA